MRTAIILLGALSITALSGCDKLKSLTSGGSVKLDSDKAKVSYAIGAQIGKGMKSQGLDVDPNVIAAAMSDVLANKDLRLTEEDMAAAMQKMRENMQAQQLKSAADNLEKGKAALEENKKKAGVKVTKSGLQYEVLTEGKGNSPKATDVVKVHYKGTLTDGTEFDSSYKRNEPAEFPVGGVIKGWTEALQLMKPGAKYKLLIPAELAYGDQGRPGIPANSVLAFEVEFLEVKKGK